jgi:RNA recognition motif-containing protein
VQPALTAIQRQVVIQREQQRFKNSKKKCNLFVKNFPEGFSVEELRPHFARFGEIESIKILPSHDGQPSTRAFVCFKQPDCAAYARANLHGSALNGKQLYVTNYELPEIRRKQQAEAKDRADFFNQRKQVTQNQFDVNILQKPETIQLIQQILFLMQKQFNGRMPF